MAGLDETMLQTIATRLDDQLDPVSVVAGGSSSLNQTYRVTGRIARYFIKINTTEYATMMQAELAGLQELERARAIRVPKPLAAGVAGAQSFIAMEWLDIGATAPGSEVQLGRELAQLHNCTQAQFGWHRDNTIGLTPQINTCDDDWGRFFASRRLEVQLDFLEHKAFDRELVAGGRDLAQRLPDYFAGQSIVPGLLHGDLWGGNWGALGDGTPVLFDPAVYFGDAESDIAMTQLFGGFGPRFYAAYREIRADPADGPVRRELYQFYHLLNHCNLFGQSYRTQAWRSLQRLLTKISD
ncbi:MAG: phosphotransferase [Gammaproteobacteria bacterium]|nr:phosphotransferase [Gammaproteobacteria bacterium]